MFANRPRPTVISAPHDFLSSLFRIPIAAWRSQRARTPSRWPSWRRFSSFKTVNLDKLASGSVMATRGPAMSFPRGLAVESCYIVRRPLQKTGELHQQWSP